MISTKKKVIIVGALVVLFGVFFIKLHQYHITEVQSKCRYLRSERYGGTLDIIYFENCFGVISIESSAYFGTNRKRMPYTIRDDKHNYDITTVADKTNYKLVRDNLYIYDDYFPLIAAPDRLDPVNYGERFFVDGELQSFTYPHLVDVPKYIKVDINTGEVLIHTNSLDEISDSDRSEFEKLKADVGK